MIASLPIYLGLGNAGGIRGVGGGQKRCYNAPLKVTLLRKFWGLCVENLEEEGRVYMKVTFRNT